VDCCSQIPVRGDDGGRAIGAIDDDIGWHRRCASYRVIDNRSEILQRARRQIGRIGRGCAEQTDRLEPAVRLLTDVADSF
jgi:hypothetical protein